MFTDLCARKSFYLRLFFMLQSFDEQFNHWSGKFTFVSLPTLARTVRTEKHRKIFTVPIDLSYFNVRSEGSFSKVVPKWNTMPFLKMIMRFSSFFPYVLSGLSRKQFTNFAVNIGLMKSQVKIS